MNDAVLALDANALKEWIVNYISSVLEISADAVAASPSFAAIGLDSLEAVIMAGVMEEEFGVQIEPSMFFDDPTINGLIDAFRKRGLVA